MIWATLAILLGLLALSVPVAAALGVLGLVLDELYASLPSHGIDLERADYDVATAHITRQLAYAVTRYTLGAPAELARRSLDDQQLGAALALLRRR